MSHRLLSVAGALALLVAPMYAQTAAPKLLPGTKPGVLSTIAGKAMTSTNAPMGSTLIRLRDVRFGRVVATTITDKAGQFEFKGVDVGSYIVEMMTPSSDVVLASSSILYVDSGEILSTLLRMPLASPALGSLLSGSAPSALSAAQAVTAAAASSNTPAATPAGEPATSQNPTRRAVRLH
jgi:hypothetical protein